MAIDLPVLAPGAEPALSPSEIMSMQEEVRALARTRRAVILAHNYQVPEVQDVADFVGDSLGLAREATRVSSDAIVMCGVYFMAETAKILNPERTVLLPDVEAGCSLADAITAEDVRAWKCENPGAVVVSYVNTTAAVKAESDYCVTSGNAEAVVRAIPEDTTILFLPDFFLGTWLQKRLGRKNMKVWLGECHVHAGIRPEELAAQRASFPDADLLIHPECGCSSQYVYGRENGMMSPERSYVLSTEGMLKHAASSGNDTFLVATETGIIHRLRKEMPSKTFLAADRAAVCTYMKRITLPKLHRALRDMAPEIVVDPEVAARARVSIDRMLAIAA